MFSRRTHADVGSFLDVAQEALAASETANNLILGVPMSLRADPLRFQAPDCLLTVHDEAGALVGAAVRTPPHHLIVHVEAAAVALGRGGEVLDTVLDALLEAGVIPSGVNGRVPWSEEFAARWEHHTGDHPRLRTELRAFELREVVPPLPAAGGFRQATDADVEVVAAFLRAFDAEALPGSPGDRSDEAVHRTVSRGNIFLWVVDGQPVSLAGRSRALVRGVTVAPVYTPPEQRGRGYASNVVAALTQRLLDDGWEYVALFTDLSNPTSNSIYQKIGYRPVCDYADYAFEVGQLVSNA